MRLRWFEVVPVAHDYDNTRTCRTMPPRECAEPIEYRLGELPEADGRWEIETASIPALARTGTHRLVAYVGEGVPPVPDASAVVDVPAVVVRRDDTYVGFASELMGLPFIFFPAYLSRGHKTALRLGADCVALVIYGRRRMGEHIPYYAPRALPKVMHKIAEGQFVPGAAPPRIPIAVGDVLHFGHQTAVVSVDREPLGELGPNDLILQTFHGVAEELPLEKLPYASEPFQVFRWP